MEVQDYCSGMAAELMAWKAKIFDVAVKADKLGTADKDKVWQDFNELKIIVRDLEDKIHTLQTECPSEWSPQKQEIDEASVDMRSKYMETLDYIGKASPVSVPG